MEVIGKDTNMKSKGLIKVGKNQQISKQEATI